MYRIHCPLSLLNVEDSRLRSVLIGCSRGKTLCINQRGLVNSRRRSTVKNRATWSFVVYRKMDIDFRKCLKISKVAQNTDLTVKMFTNKAETRHCKLFHFDKG